MTANFHTGTLNDLNMILTRPDNQPGPLHECILAFQGHGDASLNALVNEMIFLRRELRQAEPDKQKVQQLVTSIYHRAGHVNSSIKGVEEAAKRLRQSIVDALN